MFLILNEIRVAYTGKRLWVRLKKKHSVNKEDCLVLMPHVDSEINLSTVKHLKSYLRRKAINRALVVTNDFNAIASLKQLESENDELKIDIVETTIDKIQNICKYYRMIHFHKEIIVVSIEEPFGSKGLLGKTAITIDDMVKYSILGW
ncbi:hypothetical protein COLU111180_03175 [Cohnella lubricantis]|uniref:Uncharacterized protein n=1 Tax=Cohnella lubricantis TaxID=2163172 RepID=A0A841TBJ1_9BACL|nr:hypothetical protein [Cohnella lubricantis]MBB6677395.1 hypothetical protein [Cohnella lubricantis]MBP2118714.1 hypothetical protein [Cohnella lubricantis]